MITALLSKRIRTWLFFALAVPALSWGACQLGKQLEQRKGPSKTSAVLQKSGGWLEGRSKGPLKHRK